MTFKKSIRKKIPVLLALALLVFSCMKLPEILSVQETAQKAQQKAKDLRDKTSFKLAEGLQLSLWASDSLAPDPVAMDIDHLGRVYLTRTNRQKNSEFDIRGHRDWMTESIGLQSVEDRRAFLRKTFAPERSKENSWLEDLNNDGSHDWRDLAVERDEIWRLEDTDKDGMADKSTRILNDFYEEVTDVAGGLLVTAKNIFVAIAPDLWKVNYNKGVVGKKTSISHGYAVHIGFGGHGMSGVTEGPDGRLYWNIGDIGANITAPDGKHWPNPNSGLIARANPDGSDFEIFATGLRNTHEFAFDEYGNLISSDNDGDHPGESERLVHVVEGSDAGWRSNWQYGKYTDPKNNKYNVWMDEKLYKPRWEGQAAYIIPPIMNYHNGPTGMVYNPGTALGSAWKNKFFLVEFVGTPARSPIWAFDLKPKGASFELKSETNVLTGILPTGIKFGPDGALYVADWVNGWGTKNYGRVWKLDVTPDKNDLAAERRQTQSLMEMDYTTQSNTKLYELLSYGDLRIRQKAQFELVARGVKGLPELQKAIAQREHQLARIHGIWGLGQLTRMDKKHGTLLLALLKDADVEIRTQAAKMLGDANIAAAGSELVSLLKDPSPRMRFYAAEALGQLAYAPAIEPLITLLQANNDEDLYIRHAAVLALARIGQAEPLIALAKSPSKALRTAAVLVLRKLKHEKIALYLQDVDEYIVTEAARAINDDLSIPAALPALAATLQEKRFSGEPLLRRAINAALRVGGAKELDMLIAFASRSEVSDVLKAEALATIGSWGSPSLTDRVDGRYRGKLVRDAELARSKIKPLIGQFLETNNPDNLIAIAGMLSNLNLGDANETLAKIYYNNSNVKVRSAMLSALNSLKYRDIDAVIKNGMEDKEESLRTVALGLLNNNNVTKATLPAIAQIVFGKGSTREQQQLLVVMGKLDLDKTQTLLEELVDKLQNKQLSPNLRLELKEAIDASGSASLKAKMASMKPGNSLMDDFAEVLYGGNWAEGRNIFNNNNTAQCTRCHAVRGVGGTAGPSLSEIASTLSREQLLQALIEPSARISPGFGTVTLKLKDGQEVFGTLLSETESALSLQTSNAEPLVIPLARIASRDNTPSSMPPVGEVLSKREIRDLVEYLASLRK
jgi:putative membrane-bound dehydrogenase-like protein